MSPFEVLRLIVSNLERLKIPYIPKDYAPKTSRSTLLLTSRR